MLSCKIEENIKSLTNNKYLFLLQLVSIYIFIDTLHSSIQSLLLGYIFSSFLFYKFLDFYVYYFNLFQRFQCFQVLQTIWLLEIAESNKYINEVKVTGIENIV